MSDTLDEEISPFGLRSICFDSGCFRTPVLDKRPRWKSAIEEYREAGEAANAALLGKQFNPMNMVIVVTITTFHTFYSL